MFLRLSWILTLVQAFEGPLFDEDVGPDVDVSQNDQFSDTTPKSQMSSLSGLGRTSSSSAQSISLDPHTDPARFSILQQKNFNFCGYPAVRHNHNLFNVGPATEISTAYPLPQNKYQKFENGTFGSITRIVNGDESSVHSWPWQVRVRPCNGYRKCTFLCGGSIISSRWVLTAAHCLEGESQRGIYVENDIGLIKLDRPMEMNGCVGTVCLPTSDVAPGSTCWITGWGTLSSGGKSPSILQEASVSVLSLDECRNTRYSRSEITDDMLCAQGRSRNGGVTDACQGDSGGPLVCEAGGSWTIYGATSWGYGCASASYPGVWSRVHYNLDWIESAMA